MSTQFLLGAYIYSEALAESIQQHLFQQSFAVHWSQSPSDYIDWIVINRHIVDCLIVQSSVETVSTLSVLKRQDLLLPTLMLVENLDAETLGIADAYHEAVVELASSTLSDHAGAAVKQAVERYLHLPTHADNPQMSEAADRRFFILGLQKQRIAQKLNQSLDRVSQRYKRDEQKFLRNMPSAEQQEFVRALRQDYRLIVLNYFKEDVDIDQQIEDLATTVFFADVPVPKIVELHMDLIDAFSKQLRLEGRDDGILVDYRLTLIDVLAHLSEKYRRFHSQYAPSNGIV